MSRHCARILEIGQIPYFKSVFPQATVFAFTGRPGDALPGLADMDASLPGLLRLLKACRGGAFDLLVVHPERIAPWSLDWLLRNLVHRSVLRGRGAPLRGLAQLLPLLRRDAALAVLDFDDHPFVRAHHERLLASADRYFKRELPVDRWRVFLGRSTGGLPSRRFRLDPRRHALLAKIEPLPLGLPLGSVAATRAAPSEKTTDLFFAGLADGNSWLRETGLSEVRALAAAGFRVDVPDGRLPPAEFAERCARAWMVWSPEGLGWDCFRHYEAGAVWSVPLISRPTVERRHPLADGRHAVFYDPEPGGLTQAFRAAIGDKDRLTRIAAAAHDFVLAHHTPAAICRDILATLGFTPPERDAAAPAATPVETIRP